MGEMRGSEPGLEAAEESSAGVFSCPAGGAGEFSAAYAAPILKCVGIAMAARLGSDVCRDAGQTAVASSLETCGAVCALYVSLPLLKALLRTIGALA